MSGLIQKLGGLFEIPGPAGGVTGTDQPNPAFDQRMAMAEALLQAGGPQLRPISFGQVMAQALSAGQQAKQNALARAEQMKLNQLKLQQSGIGNIDPDQFTPESVAKYQKTRNYGDLVPKPAGQTGVPGSLQELAAINQERQAAGKPPMSAEEYLGSKRGTSADMQAYNHYLIEHQSTNPEQPPMSFLDYSKQLHGGVEGAQQLAMVGMKRFDAQYQEASSARNAINTIQRASELIDEGIKTGTAAGGRNAIARGLDTLLGRKTDDTALSANTDAYIANAGQLVGQVIKQFGSGTGLSDADREFAKKIAGGDITINEAALRRILEINYKVNKFAIDKYNRQFNRLKGEYSPVRDFYEPIDVPEFGQGSSAPETLPSQGLPTGWKVAVK